MCVRGGVGWGWGWGLSELGGMLLALHDCVIRRGRVDVPGRGGGGEGGLRLRSPAHRVCRHLSANPVQPPRESKRERRCLGVCVGGGDFLTACAHSFHYHSIMK